MASDVERSPRTGLRAAQTAVLRAVDAACHWGPHRPRTAPTTRTVRHLRAVGFEVDAARAALSALGSSWLTLAPLLTMEGNWGSAQGDPPADDEYTRVGLSDLGRLALDAEQGRCGPVPLGMVLWSAASGPAPAVAPGFGLPAVLAALAEVMDDPDGAPHAAQRLGVPALPRAGSVEVDLAALLAGGPVTAFLGCRFTREPASLNPSPPPGPPPEVLARLRPGESVGWASYGPRTYSGPSLVITGTPTGVDLDTVTRSLVDAVRGLRTTAAGDVMGAPAVTGAAAVVAEVRDESSMWVGTRILLLTDDPAADLDAVETWVSTIPGATAEERWCLGRPAHEELRVWAQRVCHEPDGLQRLQALGATPRQDGR